MKRGGRTLQLIHHIGDVGRCLETSDSDREDTGYLVHFSTAALTVALQFLEIRYHHDKQLYHDGCCNVRHDTQCENGGVGKSTTGEHIQQSQQTLGTLFLQSAELRGVDTRKDDIGTNTIDKYQPKGVKYSLTQVLNRPNVFECLDKSLHCVVK